MAEPQTTDEIGSAGGSSHPLLPGVQTLVTVIAVAITAYVAYATFMGPYKTLIVHRALFLMAMLVVLFLCVQTIGAAMWQRTLDVILTLIAVVSCGFVVLNYETILSATGAASMDPVELFVGAAVIILTLEAARRVSVPLFVVALLGCLYTMYGNALWGPLQHAGVSTERFVYLSAFSSDGVFGLGLAVASTYLFMFMLFGAAMQHTGAGSAFSDLANALVGKYRGGSAKGAVVSSSALGGVVGSAMGNVATTGAFTIPLMKRMGFSKERAGAVEVVSSEGAQLIPPVMGAAAFIMVEITGIPYATVALAAIIPAFLYYLATFIVVDLEAAKHGLAGMPPDQLPRFKVALKSGFHYLIPVAVLMYLLLVTGVSVTMAGLVAIGVTVLVTQARSTSRVKPSAFIRMVDAGVRSAAGITALIACIGLIQQAFVITGLGARLADILVPLAGGNGLLLLIIAMMVTVLLGMGMPTPIAYILAAVFVAPALLTLGFETLPIHMFLFYFAIKSGSTPPVAMVAVVAAGISGGDFWRTAWLSFYYALPGFAFAYAFVYHPELLMQGTPLAVIYHVGLAAIATACFSFALIGYRQWNIEGPSRLILTGCGVLLLIANPWTVVAAFALMAALVIRYRLGRNRQRDASDSPEQTLAASS